jgi:O-antigen/teichoic acid export membrane protein
MSNTNGGSTQFKDLFKSLSVLGGTSVLNSIITVIRVKLIAVLLGPYGMGLSGLFSSSLGLIRNFTEFGVSISAVKDVAKASSDSDDKELGKIVAVVGRLVWFTGLLGSLAALIFAPFLSRFAFENESYAYAFRLLSVILLFNQLTSGKIILIQGLSKFKLLAKSQLSASLFSLILTIPLYYFFKEEGIVPALIVTAIVSYGTFWFFTRKIEVPAINVTKEDVITKGGAILKLGVLLSLSILLSKLVEYLIRIYITRNGSIDDVGLYNAAFSIVNTYVAMFFASLMSDFYPRLSKNSEDPKAFSSIINDQTMLLVLIVTPVLIACLLFSEWLILILYTREFLSIEPLILWLILAMFFKCVSWLLGYLILAKNDSKVFLYTQIFKNVIELSLSILLYNYYGLLGLGISFLVTLFLSYFLSLIISYRVYGFSYDSNTIYTILLQLMLLVLSFLVIHFFAGIVLILIIGSLLTFSVFYSFRQLDPQLGLTDKIISIKQSIFTKRK